MNHIVCLVIPAQRRTATLEPVVSTVSTSIKCNNGSQRRLWFVPNSAVTRDLDLNSAVKLS